MGRTPPTGCGLLAEARGWSPSCGRLEPVSGGSSIDLVIWDIGNVLVRWDVRALYRTIFDDHDEMERFLAEVWTSEHNLRCDRGEPYEDVIADVVAAHPEYEVEVRAVWERWIETIPGEVPGALDLLREVKATGVRMWALSNFSLETFPLIAGEYPHFAELDGMVLSGEVGISKPDPEIYRLVLERAGVAAERAVLLDDSELNVAGAAAVGIEALRFTDVPAARRALRTHRFCDS